MDESMILVVDDHPGIADAAAMMLNREGYCALALYKAADAIEMLSKVDVALIVTDVNMPEMNGVDLALKTRELRPRTGILLMSGDDTAASIWHERGCEVCPFEVMAKPFRARQLLDRIKSIVH
ncbi:MAG: response regulator [Terriglobales bacterium]|jgi:two-component system response regulator ResD